MHVELRRRVDRLHRRGFLPKLHETFREFPQRESCRKAVDDDDDDVVEAADLSSAECLVVDGSVG